MTTFINLPTVFHITHYKSGSQWVYNVLQACAPERIMPPRIEVAQFLGQDVVRGMIYPTLYVTRDEFESVDVPEQHIKFVTMRDLRDSIVSWYFSASKSHKEAPNLIYARDSLNAKSLESGLQMALRGQGKMMASFQLSWANSDTMIIRYEDLLADELTHFRRIIRHARLPVSDKFITDVVNRFSFSKRSGRRRGKEDTASHLRKGVHGDWANYLKGNLLEEFKEYFDDVLIETGYEKDRDWGLDLLPKRVQGVDVKKSHARTTGCWCGCEEMEPFSPFYKRCLDCGTLVHKTLHHHRFYKETKSTAAGPVMNIPSGNITIGEIKLQARQYLSRKDTLTKFKICLNYLEPNARILQINAETGAFVSLLKQAGFDAAGLNPHPISHDYINFHRHILRVPMLYGALEWQNIKEDSLDAIILTNILGMTIDPVELIEYCKQWLRPDGKLIIHDYILSDNRSYEAMKIGGSAALFPLFIHEHQHIFTPDSIDRILIECDYPETVKMYLPNHTLTLREKYVDVNMSKTCIIASHIPFEYHPASEEALYQLQTGYTVHALLDMYRDLALAYQTLEEERELWISQAKQFTVASPEMFLQTNIIQTGTGWYSGEIHNHTKFAWVANDAELIIHSPIDEHYHMYMDIEPGPSADENGLALTVMQTNGTEIESFFIRSRQKIFFTLPVEPDRSKKFILHVDNGDKPLPDDPRILNYRVFGMGAYKPTQEEPEYTLKGSQDMLVLGSGWYTIETQNGRKFRWANNNVEFIVYNASGRFNRVAMEIHGGPSLKHGIFQLDLLNDHDEVVDTTKVPGKGTIHFELPIRPLEDNHFRLRVHGGGLTVPNDPRILNFRIFGIGWARE